MSNSVNFYEFIGYVTLNLAEHELTFQYSFLLNRILVSMVSHATMHTLKPTKPKEPKKSFSFLGFYQL